MELHYHNDSRNNPYPNPVPGCNGLSPCPLSLFNELVKDVLADDWQAECGFKTKWSSTGEQDKVYNLCLCLYLVLPPGFSATCLLLLGFFLEGGGLVWDYSEQTASFKHIKAFGYLPCVAKQLLSPTGTITALAVAVGLLAVALLFSIGVIILRRRGQYSREV